MTRRLDPNEHLQQVNEAALAGYDAHAQRVHARGQLTARERIDCLLDAGSFLEIDRLVTTQVSDFGMQQRKALGDGVIVGAGLIDGRKVFVFAQDAAVLGGSLGQAHASKIVKLMDLALKVGAPIIGLNDSGGARIQEGVRSLGGYADIFVRNTRLSGVVPQISCVLGPCAGGAVYSPAITDFVFMVEEHSYMFITGPDVIRAVTHEQVDKESLGGAATCARKSGVSHLSLESDQQCLAAARRLFGYLPSNNLDDAPRRPTQDPCGRAVPELDRLIPLDSQQPYDMRDVIKACVDDAQFFELQPDYARNIVTGFAHLGGASVGIVANQPAFLAGVLDIAASRKAARFVRFCDAFNLPVITWVDVPGFLPGVEQEHNAIIAHGAKLLYAYCEATVPKLTVITRKAYGGAYDVMSSKHVGADVNLAFPMAEIAVMGAEGAVNIIHRHAISQSPDPAGTRQRLVDEYVAEFANPYRAAELGFIDEVIFPRDARTRLCHWLQILADKRERLPPKKHGNIPL